MCCDKYEKVYENIYALAKGIEALRGMERWGVNDFIERAFTGFTALPPSMIVPYKKPWWDVLGINKGSNEQQIKEAYHRKAQDTHPDKGGTHDMFVEVGIAYEEGMESLKN